MESIVILYKYRLRCSKVWNQEFILVCLRSERLLVLFQYLCVCVCVFVCVCVCVCVFFVCACLSACVSACLLPCITNDQKYLIEGRQDQYNRRNKQHNTTPANENMDFHFAKQRVPNSLLAPQTCGRNMRPLMRTQFTRPPMVVLRNCPCPSAAKASG